jgi:hypothetical protein
MPSGESNAEDDVLRRALRAGLNAYKRFRSGAVPIGEYVNQHGSFFYEWDLEGHESGAAWQEALASNGEAVDLLRRIQQIFDRGYASKTPLPAFEEAGRLTPARALDALMRLASEPEIDALLERLDGGKDEAG